MAIKCAKTRVLRQKELWECREMLCIFKMVADNLYPNSLIGVNMVCSREHTKLLTGRGPGVQRSPQRGPSPPGPECASHSDQEVLGSESSHVKSAAYYMLSIREVFPRSVWSLRICMKKKKKGLGKTVTCELIKSQRLLSGWMAFPPLTRKRLSWGAFAAVALEVRKMYPLRPNGAILWSPYSTWAGSNRKEANCLWISTPAGLAGIPQEKLLLFLWTAFHVEGRVRPICVNRLSLLDCPPANQLHYFILNILFFQINTRQSQHCKFQIENYNVLLLTWSFMGVAVRRNISTDQRKEEL